MKKLRLMLAAIVVTAAFASCTPENTINNEYQTDKDKVCPPNDQNCNGIPDDEEED